MSGGIETLVIPVRMDTKDAAAALKRLEAAGKEAGDGVKDGMDKGAAGAKNLGDNVADLIKAQMGLSAIRQVASAMGDEFRRSADEVNRLATQFADVRQAMQQVAALRGEGNSNQFTVEQVRAGARAGLTPQEWTRAQEEFQSRAGAYIGKDAGDQGRLDDKQGEEYQQQIAAFAKARGINPSEAMGLGGGLLQFSEGKQDVKGLMSRYGKVFKTLERAPTPVAQLLPQMSRLMGQGFSPEEAAQALAIQSEANPGEEQTFVTSALKAVTDARLEGKGAALGLKEGMTPMQQLEAASRTLRDRIAAGEDQDTLMKEYAPRIEEKRGLLGFINRGVGAQGFERVRGYAAGTPDNFTSKAVEEYEKSDEGRAARRRADLALAEAERGELSQPVMEQLELARIEATRRGDLEQGRVSNAYRGTIGAGTGVDSAKQIVNQEALRRLRTRAAGLGIVRDEFAGFQADTVNGGVAAGDAVHRSQASVNAEIRDLLQRIAAATQQQADQGAKPGPALTVPTPVNNGGPRQ
jgi:hypothetical protein